MIKSQPVTVVRTLRRCAGNAERCALCKLFLNNVDPHSYASFEIQYNGEAVQPENPLCALNRRKVICDNCIWAIADAAKDVIP